MAHTVLNAYRIMWLFVFFDLPVTEKKDMKRATRFRKDLLSDGFAMMQFSVYSRHCASKESLEVHQKRIKALVPEKGTVSLLAITDKQYGNMITFWGKKETEQPRQPAQLEMF